MGKILHAVILSTKSAGSSALHSCLISDYAFKGVQRTKHFESETLFWSKAASMLGLPQDRMHRSVVPYEKHAALDSLNDFLKINNISPVPINAKKNDIFRAYKDLATAQSPFFVEKSPHHLFNSSNLQLLKEFMEWSGEEIEFKIIGLVRHPMSVIYSGWQRWKFDCDEFEQEWCTSYRNLLAFQDLLNIRIIRYEDLVVSANPYLKEYLLIEPTANLFSFQSSSIDKWKFDKGFAHVLKANTIELAKGFGYDDFVASDRYFYWFWRRTIHRGYRAARSLISSLHRNTTRIWKR